MSSPASELETRVVVPCYNEEHRLDTGAFAAHVEKQSGVGFLFVNDGSCDGTLEMLRSLKDRLGSAAVVLDLGRNRGKAEAVRRGLLAALAEGAEIVGYWDADLSTPLDELPRLLGALRAGAGVEGVLASRVRLLGRQILRHPGRHYAGRFFATAASFVLGLPVYDTQCGAKLFRATPELRSALKNPFRTTWIFDVELLARLVHCHGRDRGQIERRFVEVPVLKWLDVPGSKIRLRDGVRIVFDLLRLAWRYAPAARPLARSPEGEGSPRSR